MFNFLWHDGKINIEQRPAILYLKMRSFLQIEMHSFSSSYELNLYMAIYFLNGTYVPWYLKSTKQNKNSLK